MNTCYILCRISALFSLGLKSLTSRYQNLKNKNEHWSIHLLSYSHADDIFSLSVFFYVMFLYSFLFMTISALVSHGPKSLMGRYPHINNKNDLWSPHLLSQYHAANIFSLFYPLSPYSFFKESGGLYCLTNPRPDHCNDRVVCPPEMFTGDVSVSLDDRKLFCQCVWVRQDNRDAESCTY